MFMGCSCMICLFSMFLDGFDEPNPVCHNGLLLYIFVFLLFLGFLWYFRA